MGAQVVMGAVLQCSFGVAPSSLVVPPTSKVMGPVPAANILDNKPIANIPPFGMCQSLANPTVAAATAAALGVLTPMPCVPATAAPWVPGCPKVMVGNMPALDSNSKLMCSYGGVIQVVSPGQVKIING
ncbi:MULTISPECIES: DUF4280 domain-containing protein [Myxococcus]|uniref:DUF4280 domain-containing protein n=2 Tax=Myxococcus TaxID=32 RepID=L7U8S6_MYXSD|nr:MULTISPECIES: DUF4280 domain-containing protein [Myxococcus]AGC44493.1 hypothetical protein MYSTI_03179 [Myxococcus stipitatus DSM 14675]QSQ16449.1 DUF4280 domain-containing protein [Myxococcus landrumus]